LEYKYVELVSIEFETSMEESIREAITFRYNSVKAKLIFLQNRMKEFSSLVKTKNPSLLIQMQKTMIGGGAPGHNQSTQSFQKKGQGSSFFPNKK
jgi:hypothetical protein